MALPCKRRADERTDEPPPIAGGATGGGVGGRLPQPPPMAAARPPLPPPRLPLAMPAAPFAAPGVPRDVMAGIEEAAMRAQKRARLSKRNCDRVLEALAEQALAAMRARGMPRAPGGDLPTPPQSPRSFYKRIGIDSLAPLQLALPRSVAVSCSALGASVAVERRTYALAGETSPTPVPRMPLASVPVNVQGSADASATAVNEGALGTAVLNAHLGTNGVTPNRGKAHSGGGTSVTPARVQAARCLLSFSQ